MTASTPPLVDVIAGVIYKARWVDNFGKETVLATDEAIARAVLDALEKAGGTEWGERDDDGDVTVWDDEQDATSMAHGKAHELVSRITGPWVVSDGWEKW